MEESVQQISSFCELKIVKESISKRTIIAKKEIKN